MRRRVGLLLAVALAASCLVAGGAANPVGARTRLPFIYKVAQDPDGPWISTFGGLGRLDEPFPSKFDWYFKARNTTTTEQKLAASGIVSRPGLKIRWFSGNTDITDRFDNTSGAYRFKLGPNRKQVFRAHMHMTTSPQCVYSQLFTRAPLTEVNRVTITVNDPNDCN